MYITCILSLGSSRISTAVAQIDNLGNCKVLALESEDPEDSLRHGIIVNVEAAASHIKALFQKLNNRLKSADIPVMDSVYVGLAGMSVHSILHQPSVQLTEGTAISTDILDRLSQQSLSTPLDGWDVLQVVPAGYAIDGDMVTNPVGMTGHELTARHQLIVAQKRLRANITAALQRTGLQIKGFVTQPLATADILSDDERQRGALVIDFGAATTTVLVFKGGILLNLATIPLGSEAVTSDIMTKGVTYRQADELKKQWGSTAGDNDGIDRPNATNKASEMYGIPLGEIDSVMACRYEEILANVARQIEIAGITPDQFEAGCVITGGAAMQKGLTSLVSRRLNIRRISTRGFSEFTYDNSQGKPHQTNLLAMLKQCRLDCRTKPSVPKPQPQTAASPTPPAVQPQPPSAQTAAETMGNNSRSRKRTFRDFIGDLFSGIDDDENPRH